MRSDKSKTRGKFLSMTADWLVLLSILLFLSAHFLTTLIIVSRQTTAQELNYSQKVVTQAEANPFQEWSLRLGNIGSIMSLVLLPALVFGMYFAWRKWASQPVVDNMAAVLFFMALTDVVNDLAYYLAMVWR